MIAAFFMTITLHAEGLLGPEHAQGLWATEGTIPSVSHLDKKFGSRAGKDFCGGEYNKIKSLQTTFASGKVSQSADTLRKAVAQYYISPKMLDKTLAVFLKNQTLIPNQRYITIFDHTQPSTAKRFVILDLQAGEAKGYRSAHGRGSDPKHMGKAQTFGNDPSGKTYKSSLGCALANHKYRAKKTVQEPEGRWAMTLLGFEPTNDNVCDRAVYMHAAPYIDYEKTVKQSAKIYATKPGRSWGCPAFTYAERDEVFEKINGGGLVCAFN